MQQWREYNTIFDIKNIWESLYYNNELIIIEDEKVFFGNDYPESCYSGRASVNSDSSLNCAEILKKEL